MSWFDRIIPPKIKSTESKPPNQRGVPEGLWRKCNGCSAVLYQTELEKNLEVCPKCGYHHRLNSRSRLESLLDREQEITLFGEGLKPVDTLKFRDSKRYRDRLSSALKTSGATEALVAGEGVMAGRPIVVCVFEFSFMGGSMGSVVGERFVRAVERCIETGVPLICFSASGGARMQEALISLMQMAKTSSALSELSRRKVPFISVLTDPTMGGVSASLAMLGDIIIAEPRALIGFAGPRVIEQTVRETLPDGFQTAEFLLEHGAIDMIVDRRQLKQTLIGLIDMLYPRQQMLSDETPRGADESDEPRSVVGPE